MLSLILLIAFAAIAYISTKRRDTELSPIPMKISDKLSGLWDVAHDGMKNNRLIRAEKALLTILNIDRKNAAAYNRLGILYAKQKEYKDAIDCFEIASSIEPTASSLHNLGLIYYETENYEKSAMAFDQALKLEEDMAARHIAYAKAKEKMGDQYQVIASLERAVELEANPESLTLLYRAYIAANRPEDANRIEDQLSKALATNKGKSRRVRRAKRVPV